MKTALRLTALVAYLVMMVGVSIASMIYGWGLTPENWWWIAGGYIAMLAVTVMQTIGQALSSD